MSISVSCSKHAFKFWEVTIDFFKFLKWLKRFFKCWGVTEWIFQILGRDWRDNFSNLRSNWRDFSNFKKWLRKCFKFWEVTEKIFEMLRSEWRDFAFFSRWRVWSSSLNYPFLVLPDWKKNVINHVNWIYRAKYWIWFTWCEIPCEPCSHRSRNFVMVKGLWYPSPLPVSSRLSPFFVFIRIVWLC